jgi:hypothetical protein
MFVILYVINPLALQVEVDDASVPCFAGDYIDDLDLPGLLAALEDKAALSPGDSVAGVELPAVVGLVEAASRHEAEKAVEWRQIAN